jgi:hypothetical protein
LGRGGRSQLEDAYPRLNPPGEDLA